MQPKTISEINEIYELEIDKIVKEIKKRGAKKVLLQFPEGLKPYAQAICDEINKKADCECFIWLGDCFGGCDVPLLGDLEKDVDRRVQFGHFKWELKD